MFVAPARLMAEPPAGSGEYKADPGPRLRGSFEVIHTSTPIFGLFTDTEGSFKLLDKATPRMVPSSSP